MDGSSTSAPVTVQVSPGQYDENLTIGKQLTLSGNDGTAALGADASAPEIFGTEAGGKAITVTSNNVTIDGLHLNGAVAGGSLTPSVNGVYASGVSGLTVRHNTFEGFSGPSISTPGSTNVVLDANLTISTLASIAVTPANPTIAAGQSQQFSATGTYSDASTADLTGLVSWASTNTASATISAGGLASGIAAGTSSISATSGSIVGSTTLTVSAATSSCTKSWATATDGAWSDPTMWAPFGMPTASDDVCITADGSYTVTLTGAEEANSVTLGASGNLAQPTLQLTDSTGPSTLTSATGFTNHGSLVLDSTVGYGTTLAITAGTLTNAADGSLSVTGTAGLDYISGQTVNHGGVTIAAGATLHLEGSAPTFDQAGGTLTVDGSFPVTGATFIYHGGTIPNPFVLSGATLDLAAAAASPDTFILEGTANTLASDVPTGHTLQLTDPTGPSTLTSATGFTNHGTLVLDSTVGYGTTLAITSGTLTNAADGSHQRHRHGGPRLHQRPGRQPRRRHDRGRGRPDGERPGHQRRQLHDRERRNLGDDRGHPDVRPGRWHPDR